MSKRQSHFLPFSVHVCLLLLRWFPSRVTRCFIYEKSLKMLPNSVVKCTIDLFFCEKGTPITWATYACIFHFFSQDKQESKWPTIAQSGHPVLVIKILEFFFKLWLCHFLVIMGKGHIEVPRVYNELIKKNTTYVRD
jgi:hypothetical protein